VIIFTFAVIALFPVGLCLFIPLDVWTAAIVLVPLELMALIGLLYISVKIEVDETGIRIVRLYRRRRYRWRDLGGLIEERSGHGTRSVVLDRHKARLFAFQDWLAGYEELKERIKEEARISGRMKMKGRGRSGGKEGKG
jgi:hypothetical protein